MKWFIYYNEFIMNYESDLKKLKYDYNYNYNIIIRLWILIQNKIYIIVAKK